MEDKIEDYLNCAFLIILVIMCSPVFLIYFVYRLVAKVITGKPIWDY